MRKCFAITALLSVSMLQGCGSIARLVPFFGGSSDSTRVATPAFLLSGRAARHQDSLMERLKYLAARPSPKGLSLGRLEFRETTDSVVQLVATYRDDLRRNSHGLSPDSVRAQESRRLLELRPMWADARQAKLPHPVVVRAAFRSKDYLFQNARMVEDTTEILLPDTVGRTGR